MSPPPAEPANNLPADRPSPSAPDDALPPVEAPDAGFILQLFLIPMMIVAIIVVVWLMFSWLAQMGSNPRDLVRGLKRGDDAAWQKAGILADLLRDRRKEHLKYDAALAREVADVLQQQLDEGKTQPNQINLRVFLCRALGEFHVADVLPVLLEAATVERDAASIEPPNPEKKRKLTELDVRRAALEAIAVMIKNVGPERFRDNRRLMRVLIDASSERGDLGRDEHVRRELRSTAAYTLGVLGGAQARARLARLLDDPYPNTRFNAATGLARYGDARAAAELIDMLDPDNDEAVRDERHQTGRAFKRWLVITNGIRAATLLAEKNQSDDLHALEQALDKLARADVPISVRVKAKEAAALFDRRRAAPPRP